MLNVASNSDTDSLGLGTVAGARQWSAELDIVQQREQCVVRSAFHITGALAMHTIRNFADEVEENLLDQYVTDEMLEHVAAMEAVAGFTLNDCTTLSECPAN